MEGIKAHYGLEGVEVSTDGTDYPVRLICSIRSVFSFMEAVVDDLRYCNFKQEAADVTGSYSYNAFLHNVWDQGADYQRKEMGYGPYHRKGDGAHKNEEPLFDMYSDDDTDEYEEVTDDEYGTDEYEVVEPELLAQPEITRHADPDAEKFDGRGYLMQS